MDKSLEQQVKDLEDKLSDKKAKFNDQIWENQIERLDKFFDRIMHRPIISMSTSFSYLIKKYVSFNVHHFADVSGYDGSWNSRRFIEVGYQRYRVYPGKPIDYKSDTEQFGRKACEKNKPKELARKVSDRLTFTYFADPDHYAKVAQLYEKQMELAEQAPMPTKEDLQELDKVRLTEK